MQRTRSAPRRCILRGSEPRGTTRPAVVAQARQQSEEENSGDASNSPVCVEVDEHSTVDVAATVFADGEDSAYQLQTISSGSVLAPVWLVPDQSCKDGSTFFAIKNDELPGFDQNATL